MSCGNRGCRDVVVDIRRASVNRWILPPSVSGSLSRVLAISSIFTAVSKLRPREKDCTMSKVKSPYLLGLLGYPVLLVACNSALDGHAANQDDSASTFGDSFAFSVLAVPQPDCNSNGIDDACDLSCGTTGGPCDIPGCGAEDDCDGNSVPDRPGSV